MKSLNIQEIVDFFKQYKTKKIAIFGSFARGEEHEESDIDILLTFFEPVSLLTLVRMERELKEIMGRKVDLQTEAALSPYIRNNILSEQQVIYEAA